MHEDPSDVEEQFLQERSEKDLLNTSTQIKQRQSVRTTVNLSPETFDTLSRLADHWNVPQKEIIDLALQQIEQLLESQDPAEVIEIAKAQSTSEPKRKTLVMSQNSRKRLNRLADSHDAPRDNWLALGISFVNALTKKQIEKRVEKHKQVLGRIRDYLEEGRELEKEIRTEVGSDDPVFEGFGLAITSLMNLVYEIEDEIEGGGPIRTSHL
jgi:uncharacterized protein (DUF111 family)